MHRFWNWVKANPTVASAVTSMVVAVITLCTLIVTSINSSRQIELTRQSLQDNIIYQIQKDERTVAGEYTAGRARPIDLFAQMQAVFLQRQLGSIPDQVWTILEQDFCSLMAHENLKRAWDDTTKTIFSPGFVAYMAKLEDTKSPSCGRS
jgi:hypothetical protein